MTTGTVNPDEVDMVNLFRPGDQVGPHVEAALRLKIPVIWMQQGITNPHWARKAAEAGVTVSRTAACGWPTCS